ncbi:MAG: cysteine-rich CWC family protein [Nitrospira sp.]|nr:cysteine-rich CWC family protein [Nitrospira sp.]
MSADPRDPSVCPLCRRPNDCGLAAGMGDCWCFDLSIPPNQQNTVGCDAPDDGCLCRACLVQWGQAALKTMCDTIRRWR